MPIAEEQKNALAARFRSVVLRATFSLLAAILAALLLARVLSGGGAEPRPTLILYPAFAMFLLAAIVLTFMGWGRIGGVLGGKGNIQFYETFDKGEEPESLRLVTRNFINLFEMPVLFYVCVILTHITGQVSYWMVGLAWAYVILRYVHSYVHLTANDVAVRLSYYAASGLVLLVMWGTLLVDLLGEGA